MGCVHCQSHSKCLIFHSSTLLLLISPTLTKESMDLSTLANIGTLNSLNGFTPKDSSILLWALQQAPQSMAMPSHFCWQHMLYICNNDTIKQEFKNSVRNCFNIIFLGPGWSMVVASAYPSTQRHNPDAHNQHCFLNTLQHYDPNSKFPECETPFPPDYTFSKDSPPVPDHDKHIVKEWHKCFPLCSAVCMQLSLTYNTQNIHSGKYCKLLTNSTGIFGRLLHIKTHHDQPCRLTPW